MERQWMTPWDDSVGNQLSVHVISVRVIVLFAYILLLGVFVMGGISKTGSLNLF